MTAPSEAEIRGAVKAALDDSHVDISDWVYEMTAPLRYDPPSLDMKVPEEDDAEGLWTNLRHSEAARLSDLHEAIYEQAQAWQTEVEAKITEAVVAAALTFAQEYPDAPRAVREPVTA